VNESVNKHEVATVRKTLDLPLFPLIKAMNDKDWDVSLRFPYEKEDGYVSFRKHSEWNGRPTLACKCSYGYKLTASDEDTVLRVAQRSAELCLRVQEHFTHKIPGTPNIHGVITPDIVINDEGRFTESYEDFVLRHADKSIQIVPMKDGLRISLHCRTFRVDDSDVSSLHNDVLSVLNIIRGRCAFSD